MDQKQAPTAPTRPASTVVLVREYEHELQIYLLKRNSGSAFFPGSYVFPGGALNPEDREAEFWQTYIDLPPEALLKIFGSELDVAEVIAYGLAAIRETFEEAGVFLAQKINDRNDSFENNWERTSTSELDEGWLRQKVSNEGWMLSFSNLFPWSHWITPKVLPKRFDTRFFLAFMPEGQECVPDNQETVHGLWVSPIMGLRGNMQGRIPLSPPTLVTLHELLKFETLKSFRQEILSRSWGDPRQPIQMIWDKGVVLVQPWDPDYGRPIKFDPVGLKEKVIPIGEPFSRLWLDQGIWRPVR